jgi:hypothetical protein
MSNHLTQKQTTARSHESVENRFQSLTEITLPQVDKPMRVLLLADDKHPANVVIDHIEAFRVASQHKVKVINPIHTKCPNHFSATDYDVLMIHYSIYALGNYFLSPEWAYSIACFEGLKIQIIQDEHRNINQMKARMRSLGVQAVFSSLALTQSQKVYDGPFMEGIEVFSCLPGYFSERLLSLPKKPLNERKYDIIYRGRTLPWTLGKHAQEKSDIANAFTSWVAGKGLKLNINSVESERLYGADWDHFIQNGRAMIGTEGGATIFDFDGSLQSQYDDFLLSCPSADLEHYWNEHLRQHEELIVHKTITPKIFEAIAAKTALVLFPAEWSGVLEPDRHYIPLQRDGSNISEVITKVRDDEFLTDLVERTYVEIAERPELSFHSYIDKIDRVIANTAPQGDQRAAERHFHKQLLLLETDYSRETEKAADLQQELNELQHEIFVAGQNLEISQQKRAALQTERDTLHTQLAALQTERDTLHTQLAALQTERDTLHTERDTLHTQLKEFDRLTLRNAIKKVLLTVKRLSQR